MATFPALKTGAVAQYGSSRTRGFSTQVFRFLDGSEQRFQDYGAPLRRWTIRLSLLDEAELTALKSLHSQIHGMGPCTRTAVSITISSRHSTGGRRTGWRASL